MAGSNEAHASKPQSTARGDRRAVQDVSRLDISGLTAA
jgi:hypothetical protein